MATPSGPPSRSAARTDNPKSSARRPTPNRLPTYQMAATIGIHCANDAAVSQPGPSSEAVSAPLAAKIALETSAPAR